MLLCFCLFLSSQIVVESGYYGIETPIHCHLKTWAVLKVARVLFIRNTGHLNEAITAMVNT